MKRSFTLLLCLVGSVGVEAGNPLTGKQRADKIAPYLDNQTVAVGYADLAKIPVAEFVTLVTKNSNLSEQQTQAIKAKIQKVLASLRKVGVKEMYGVINLAELQRDPTYFVVPIQRGKGEEVAKLLAQLNRGRTVKQYGQIVYVGNENTTKHFRNDPPKGLTKAFAATADGDAQAIIVLSDLLRKALGETVPQLPKKLGGGSLADYANGLRWAAAGLRYRPKLAVSVIVQNKDNDAAKTLFALTKLVFAQLGKELTSQKTGIQLPNVLLPKLEGSRLVLRANQDQLMNPLMQLASKTRQASARLQSQNNLKQIGLAFHNFHDVVGKFPAQATYKNNKPLLSWRVHLLPYLEQEHLYKQFKLDEPWDSPHNKKLIVKMPKVYQAVYSKAPVGKTVYLVPVGKKTLFPGKKGFKITEIPDGTSNTILALEVDDSHAVIWTKPEDLTVNPKTPWKGLGKQRGAFLALLADGSVRGIGKDTDSKVVSALFTRNGGEPTNLP
ncbi:MAG: DUF1559 domain-containing protein [Gemmataceae bacterium]